VLTGSDRPSSVLELGWEGLRDLEGRAAAAAARVLGARWPASRWPIHVFTAGAITCMLTSSVCHLLGCCSFHISQARAQHRAPASGASAELSGAFQKPVCMLDALCWLLGMA